MLDDFIALSEILTGISPLNSAAGDSYLKRCQGNPDIVGHLKDLIATFRDIKTGGADMDSAIRQRIMMDPILGPCAEQVIYLWYVSAFFKKNPADPQKGVWQYGSAEQYDEALIWQVIRGHAPMTDGMTYGFWADPPAESIGFRDSARSVEHG